MRLLKDFYCSICNSNIVTYADISFQYTCKECINKLKIPNKNDDKSL